MQEISNDLIEVARKIGYAEIDRMNEQKNRRDNLINWILCLGVGLIFVIILIFVMVNMASADEVNINRLANAIYKAENSQRYPYGVKSIETRGNVALARKICLNSIRNAKKRYCRSGCQGDFITFMSKRYCPISDCPRLNKNWIKNVKFWYAKSELK